MDLLAAADTWRRDGVVVLPGHLAGPDLELARAGLTSIYPTAEDYHADPLSERNHTYTGDEYGGIIPFPFPAVALCNLAWIRSLGLRARHTPTGGASPL